LADEIQPKAFPHKTQSRDWRLRSVFFANIFDQAGASLEVTGRDHWQ
jgi:hypothetical protein